jgi:hypothetical protein
MDLNDFASNRGSSVNPYLISFTKDKKLSPGLILGPDIFFKIDASWQKNSLYVYFFIRFLIVMKNSPHLIYIKK